MSERVTAVLPRKETNPPPQQEKRSRGQIRPWIFSTQPLALWIMRGLVLLAAIVLLEISVSVKLVSPFFVPRPSDFLPQAVQNLFNPQFLTYTAITLVEVLAAFLASTIVGVGLGFLFWRFKTVGKAYEPLVAALFGSPIVLLYPVFIIFFGRTSLAIVVLAITTAALPIILFTQQALSTVGSTFLKVGASLKLSEWETFRHILLPAAAPTIFTGLRIGLTFVLIVVVSTEYILQIGGLGNFIAEVSLMFQASQLYAGVTLVIAMSALFVALTYKLEKLVHR
jgi:NitT/TauT family transport system permease protein